MPSDFRPSIPALAAGVAHLLRRYAALPGGKPWHRVAVDCAGEGGLATALALSAEEGPRSMLPVIRAMRELLPNGGLAAELLRRLEEIALAHPDRARGQLIRELTARIADLPGGGGGGAVSIMREVDTYERP